MDKKRIMNIQKQHDYIQAQKYINSSIMQDQQERQEQIEKRTKYKELLDKQMAFNRKMRRHNKMSLVEKQLNRAELKAYKNYDSSNYALVPGMLANREFQHPYTKSQK